MTALERWKLVSKDGRGLSGRIRVPVFGLEPRDARHTGPASEAVKKGTMASGTWARARGLDEQRLPTRYFYRCSAQGAGARVGIQSPRRPVPAKRPPSSITARTARDGIRGGWLASARVAP